MTIFSFRRVATVTATAAVAHVHAVMAGGAQAQGRQAGGIGYLDFAALDDAFPAAAAACA
jgi:hypothetical protein